MVPRKIRLNEKISVDDIPNNDNDLPAQDPPRWSAELPLRDDQKRALRWMLNKESEGRSGAVGMLGGAPEARRTLSCVGCLADKIGYGKTVVSLALIDSDKDREIPVHEKLFTTNATLVVAPTHVVEQWATEAQKFLGTSVKVVALRTIEPLKGRWNNKRLRWSRRPMTVRDIQEADIVVATYALMASSANGYAQRFRALTGETVRAGGIQALDRVTANRLETGEFLEFEFPLLNQFHWRRQIVDEVQDAYDYWSPMSYEGDFSKLFLRGLSTEARWALSGTPESLAVVQLQHVLNLCEDWRCRFSLGTQIPDDGLEAKAFLAESVRRNTDCYVEGIDNVRVDQKLVFVDLTRIERLCLLAHRALVTQDSSRGRGCYSHSNFHYKPSAHSYDLNIFGICAHLAGGGKWRDQHVPHLSEVSLDFMKRLRSGDEVLKYDGSVLQRGHPVDMSAALPATDPLLPGVVTYQGLHNAIMAQHQGNDLFAFAGPSSSKVALIAKTVRGLLQTQPNRTAVIVFTPWFNDIVQKAVAMELERVAVVRALDQYSKAPSIAKTLREFNNGLFHVLVLDLNKFAAGVSLSRATDVMFVSPATDVNIEIQAIGRVRRLGFKGEAVRVHRFVARGVREEEELSKRNKEDVDHRLAHRTSDATQRSMDESTACCGEISSELLATSGPAAGRYSQTAKPDSFTCFLKSGTLDIA